MDLIDRLTKNDLALVLETLYLQHPKIVGPLLEAHSKGRKKIPGIHISFEFDEVYLRLSKKNQSILQRYVEQGGKDPFIGACCGQNECYVCRAYSSLTIPLANIEYLDHMTKRMLSAKCDQELSEKVLDQINRILEEAAPPTPVVSAPTGATGTNVPQ